MNLNDFDYDLPEELIAQTPLKDRASSRLLVVNSADVSSVFCPKFKFLASDFPYFNFGVLFKRSKTTFGENKRRYKALINIKKFSFLIEARLFLWYNTTVYVVLWKMVYYAILI